MTPDEMEAQHGKYGWNILHLLRLKSGNFAAFSVRRELLGITKTVDEAVAMIEANRKPKPTPKPLFKPAPKVDIDLSEFDL